MSVSVLAVDLGPGVLAGFTSRAGGVSADPWTGLNLALHVGDDPEHVRRNRELLAQWAGARVRFPFQVHGREVLMLGAGPAPDPVAEGDPAGGEPGCDGIVAARPGTAVGVLVADCVPVLLADPQAGVVAAAHAGRRGLLDGVLQATLARMSAAGAEPGRVRAAIGPAAGACCYEVPEAMQAEAAALLPSVLSRTRWGTPSLDLRAGCRSVLESAGVAEAVLAGGCTIEDRTLYSYRREPVTGRFAGVIRMVP